MPSSRLSSTAGSATPIAAKMRPLQRLIGTWLTEGVMLEREQETDERFKFFDRYSWLPGGHFIEHTVTGELGGAPVQGHEIIGYEGATLRATSYGSDGTVTHYRPRLSGRDWIMGGEKERFVGRFSADGKRLEGTWQRRSRGVWRGTMRVVLVRVGD